MYYLPIAKVTTEKAYIVQRLLSSSGLLSLVGSSTATSSFRIVIFQVYQYLLRVNKDRALDRGLRSGQLYKFGDKGTAP